MTVYDLTPGRQYRVIRSFKDFYDGEFRAGQVLTFVSRNFSPYHGGYTLTFEPATMYLQEDLSSDILAALGDYLAPVDPPA